MNRTQTAAPKGDTETPLLTLAAQDIELEIDPYRGGRLNAAMFGGRPVLQQRQDRSDPNPLDAGCFPLVPFSNRIRNGRFDFNGKTHRLDRNWTGDSHAIHGEGWIRPWEVLRQTRSEVIMALSGTSWWPWRYECVQTISIRGQSILLSLTLKNTGTEIMPAGLGLHPYFPRTSKTTLRFEASRVWPPMADGPLVPQAATGMHNFSAPRSLTGLQLDHCFEGWNGRAEIQQPDLGISLKLTASAQSSACVLFVPPQSDYFCFEPVTHLTGAFELQPDRAAGLVELQPGAELECKLEIACETLAG